MGKMACAGENQISRWWTGEELKIGDWLDL